MCMLHTVSRRGFRADLAPTPRACWRLPLDWPEVSESGSVTVPRGARSRRRFSSPHLKSGHGQDRNQGCGRTTYFKFKYAVQFSWRQRHEYPPSIHPPEVNPGSQILSRMLAAQRRLFLKSQHRSTFGTLR